MLLRTLLSVLALTLIACNQNNDTATLNSYPLDRCIVSDEPLGSMGEPISYVHDKQEVKFCCASCLPRFQQDPNHYLAKLSHTSTDSKENALAPTDAQANPSPAQANYPIHLLLSSLYPLTTCVVSGKALGSMGEPFIVSHNSIDVQLCCQSCVARFTEHADIYVSTLKNALTTAQLNDYPLSTCLISGDPLDNQAISMLYQGRLLQVCCEMCIDHIYADPQPAIDKLAQAIIDQQLDAYPYTICPISGEPLGSMGEPIHTIVGNRFIRLCCEGCVSGLRDNPAAALAALDAQFTAVEE